MSTNKKIIISLSSLCLAVVVALVAVIAVLATTRLTVKSQIGVTYTAKDVNVIVGAEYAFKDEAFTQIKEPMTFHTSDEEQSGQFDLNDITLTDEKPFVVLKYSFQNLSNKNYIGIKATVTPSEGTENVNVTMAYTKDALEPSSYGIIIGESLEDMVLGGGETYYIYVKLEVANISDSAAFVGNIGFDLTRSEGEPTEEQGLIKPGMILSYGEYPQTFVGADLNTTLVEEYEKLSTEEASALTATGKTYHTDINGTMTDCPEYTYTDGQRYVLIPKAKFYDSFTLSTGESSGSYGSKSMFFKVEPIQFRLMAIDGGTLTIFSEYILGSMAFGTNETWKDSNIETYLNDQFLKDSELEFNFGSSPFALETTLNNNVAEKNYKDGTGPDSTDRIWLPSISDLRTWYQDNNIKYNMTRSYLIKQPTDFAAASYIYTYGKKNGCYNLRSAGTSSSTVFYVSYGGSVLSEYSTEALNGFCPALKISVDRL